MEHHADARADLAGISGGEDELVVLARGVDDAGRGVVVGPDAVAVEVDPAFENCVRGAVEVERDQNLRGVVAGNQTEADKLDSVLVVDAGHVVAACAEGRLSVHFGVDLGAEEGTVNVVNRAVAGRPGRVEILSREDIDRRIAPIGAIANDVEEVVFDLAVGGDAFGADGRVGGDRTEPGNAGEFEAGEAEAGAALVDVGRGRVGRIDEGIGRHGNRQRVDAGVEPDVFGDTLFRLIELAVAVEVDPGVEVAARRGVDFESTDPGVGDECVLHLQGGGHGNAVVVVVAGRVGVGQGIQFDVGRRTKIGVAGDDMASAALAVDGTAFQQGDVGRVGQVAEIETGQMDGEQGLACKRGCRTVGLERVSGQVADHGVVHVDRIVIAGGPNAGGREDVEDIVRRIPIEQVVGAKPESRPVGLGGRAEDGRIQDAIDLDHVGADRNSIKFCDSEIVDADSAAVEKLDGEIGGFLVDHHDVVQGAVVIVGPVELGIERVARIGVVIGIDDAGGGAVEVGALDGTAIGSGSGRKGVGIVASQLVVAVAVGSNDW